MSSLTAEQLDGLIDQYFTCELGEPAAYAMYQGGRLYYTTLIRAAKIAKRASPEEIESQLGLLRAELWQDLTNCHRQFKPWLMPRLIWRSKPAAETERRRGAKYNCVMIRCRLAIPGVNWDTIESVHYEGGKRRA